LRNQKLLKKKAAYKKIKSKGVEPKGEIMPYPMEADSSVSMTQIAIS
jgi:hypothetical protein